MADLIESAPVLERSSVDAASAAAGLDAAGRAAALEHQAECPRCAAHLAAAQRHRNALLELPSPTLPEALAAGPFLERVHEQVSESLRADCSELLASLAPIQAPAGVAWEQVEVPRALATLLGATMQTQAAPGWLWQHIRGSLRSQRTARTRKPSALWTRARVLAAAILLVSGLLGAGLLSEAFLRPTSSQSNGTRSATSVVWVEASDPPAEGAAPAGLVRILGR